MQRNSIIIPVADTLIAIMAGMAVMPACAAFGVDFGKGPGLVFVSMQQVFINMGSFGNFVGFMFYFLVFIAAITSSISLLEVVTAYQIDKNLAFQLNVFNLGNKTYYSGVRSPHYATMAAGRSAVASLKFTY